MAKEKKATKKAEKAKAPAKKKALAEIDLDGAFSIAKQNNSLLIQEGGKPAIKMTVPENGIIITVTAK